MRKKNFSLIELLLVISIIAILAGLLLPVLNKAKDSAKSIACMNNVSSIAKAIIIYSGDARSFYPSWPETLTEQETSWDIKIMPYLGFKEPYDSYNKNTGTLFRCPSSNLDKVSYKSTSPPQQSRSYIANFFLGIWEPANINTAYTSYSPSLYLQKAERVRFPSSIAGTYESGIHKLTGSFSSFMYTTVPWKQDSNFAIVDATPSNRKYYFWHGGDFPKSNSQKMNISFLDGHVKSVLGSELYYMQGKTADGDSCVYSQCHWIF